MTDRLLRDAPVLIAELDEQLLCRRLSRGWRERLNDSAGD